MSESENHQGPEESAAQDLRFIAYKLGINGYDDAGATCDSLKRAIIEHASVTGAVRGLPEQRRKNPPRYPEQGRATDGGRNPHYDGTFEDETEEQAQNRRMVATILDTIALLEQSAGPFDEACRILRAAAPQTQESP